MMKPTVSMNHTLRFLVRVEPSFSPTGTIPISVPARKSESPIMSITPPRMKFHSLSVPNGVMVKFRIRTITIIGSTEISVSFSLATKSIYTTA